MINLNDFFPTHPPLYFISAMEALLP
uniref:Uncharacterized protein n=1 Tax=Rhizophora mucronata TaxID=61149 RepID=A0A2P2PP55_RHIMU